MHVPLDEHLHTEECNIIIRELKRCHDENNKVKQFFGVCNQLDWAMRACTRKERLARTADNIESAKVRNEKIREKMASYGDKDWREILKEKKQKQQEEQN
eukprot:TRINITY_DN76779_c0_g1_i1.p1 TRINITY_DN76779_c0_g1~~TRINITY_DN76779_c0_g1_i1.p1  ORF type:complete len:100 (+),score=19.44 TRINITY_DN76779_c0_g1_i1:57-356(+)